MRDSAHTLQYLPYAGPNSILLPLWVVDTGSGQHGVVFDLRFPQGWAVVGKDYQFCFAMPDHFQSLLVPQHILSTSHNELEPRVDWIQRFLFSLWPSSCLRYGRAPTKSSCQGGWEQERSQLASYYWVIRVFYIWWLWDLSEIRVGLIPVGLQGQNDFQNNICLFCWHLNWW